MAVDIIARALASKISEAEGSGLTIEEVDSLPDVGKDGTLYVVEETIYDEYWNSSTINKLYIYSDNKFLSLDDREIIEIFPSFDAESINITYDELVALRDNSQLIPNTQYRIIDYVTMVSSNGTDALGVKTESAGHAFDVIVIAISNNELSENALAALHDGDEYFTQDELSKWQLKYTLNNDTSKYKWAYDTTLYAYEEFETEINNGDGNAGDSYITLKYTGLKKYNGVEYHCWGTEEQIKKVSLYYAKDENAFADIVATEGEDSYGGVIVQLNGIDHSGNILNTMLRVAGGFITDSSKILVFKGEVGKGVIYYMKDDKDNICHYDFKNILYVTGSDTPSFIYNQWGDNYSFTRDDSLDVEGYYGWRCTEIPAGWNNDYCYTIVQIPSTNMILYSNTDGSEISFGGTIVSIDLGEGFVKKYTFSFEITPHIQLSIDNNDVFFTRDSSLDANGYYGWQNQHCSWRTEIYTTTEIPSSDTVLYSNTEGQEISDGYKFINAEGTLKIIDFSNSTNWGPCFANSIGETTTTITINDNYASFSILGYNTFNSCLFGRGLSIFFNTLSKGCRYNSFGGGCTYNVLGEDCYSNTFGYNCSSNTFGNECNYNTFGNECNYNTFGNECNYNTFGNGCDGNTFGDGCDYNTFGDDCGDNTFGNGCDYNTFGDDCGDNTFGNYGYRNTFGKKCYDNTLGKGCDGNVFGETCRSNTLGDSCDHNTFGDFCSSHILGDNCHGNTFGESCFGDTLGTDCSSNTFGHDCNYNTFEKSCGRNTFGNYCHNNAFGNGCDGNTFGNDCSYNTFGEKCQYITFGTSSGTIDWCQYNIIDNGCSYLYIKSTDTEAASNNYLQNVVIPSNTKGTDKNNRLTITIPDRNLDGYEIGISTYNLQGQQLTLPTYPTDTENKNYILQLTNGVLSWTLLDDGNTGEY